MNNKEFRDLKNATTPQLINGIVSEVLDTVAQGGITKISEVKPEVELMTQELFGEKNMNALINQIMAKLDNKLIVSL